MRVGISITSGFPGRDGAEAVRAVVERGRVAAQAGLDHLSLGDHHATGAARAYVQNVPAIGRIMADWPVDRSIGLLLLVPLWHPVLAAEQIGTLAAMSDAPFIVQTGIGAGSGQFAAMGASLSTRGRVTDIAIDAIDRLLAGETVDVPEMNIAGASISPRPPVPVEWWIGAGAAPAAIERAARKGDAWYASPGIDGDELRQTADAYRAECERHGAEPHIALRRDVLVGDDDAATERLARDVIERGYRGMDQQIIAGGVDHVAERLVAFESLGVDDIVARTIAVDQSTALASIELLGQVRRLIA